MRPYEYGDPDPPSTTLPDPTDPPRHPDTGSDLGTAWVGFTALMVGVVVLTGLRHRLRRPTR
jgi:hypothetical protein